LERDQRVNSKNLKFNIQHHRRFAVIEEQARDKNKSQPLNVETLKNYCKRSFIYVAKNLKFLVIHHAFCLFGRY